MRLQPVPHSTTLLPLRIVRSLSRRVAEAWQTRAVTMRNSRPIVTFTFDDCPRTAVTTGATILAERGARGTFYMAGGLEGQMWENGPQYHASDLRQLLKDGHEVGCHTFSHLNCAQASATDIALELSANRKFLEAAAPGCQPETFAYPYGSVSFAAKRAIQEHFSACRGVSSGINAGAADLGLLKAIAIPHGDEPGDWIKPFIAEIQTNKGWLILYTHDVVANPTAFGCTPRTLAETIDTIKAAGIDVLTMREAAHCVGGSQLRVAAL
jgi:peptidoglycan/xylan/chitin deacetylase (PgdA/CDA1 family)